MSTVKPGLIISIRKNNKEYAKMEEEVKIEKGSETAEEGDEKGEDKSLSEGKDQKSTYSRSGYTQGRGRPQGGPGGGFRQGRSYFRKKVCKLCVRKLKTVDYKDVDMLRKFITDRGKILPRRITGTCAKHQRVVSKAIMRARMIALLPFVSK
jgi:small subunit ribosomal protein S18